MTQVTIRRPTRRRPTFHRLAVAAIDRLTDDALALTFEVPASLRETYAFQAGQHLTVRRVESTGEDVRRSYSICSAPAALADRGELRIGVKEIPGGQFSGYAAGQLAVGDQLEVMPPLGGFTSQFTPQRQRRYVGIVAGSGITPLLSLATAALSVEPASTVTLFYGNRYARSVMFAEELADLKDRWPQRLQVVHVLSREPGDAALLSGRIDAQSLPRLLAAFLPGPASTVDEWFLCGPYGLVHDARAVLTGLGVPAPAVRTELFHVPDGDEPARAAGVGASAAGVSAEPGGEVQVTVQLDGRSSQVAMGRGERVLDAALRVRPELPYACRGGVCSTCRAKLVEGEVTMASNWALEPDELAAGYVLTCQASPLADHLVVDYDA